MRNTVKINRPLLAPKIFYFCWFASIGLLMPFLGPYYRSIGLDLAQIGVLMAIPGVLQLIASPLWSLIADGLRLQRLMLPLAVGASLLPVFLIGQTQSFGVLIVLIIVYALAVAPVPALSDSATLSLLGERRDLYGSQRVWGAVGWGVSTLISGWLVARFGLAVGFLGYFCMGILTTVAGARLPSGTPPNVDIRAAAGTLLRDRRWAIFLGCTILMGCSSAVMHNFLALYLQDLGASSEQIGLTFMLSSLSEMPVMALSPLLLRRWGSRPLLVVGGFFFVLRSLLSALAPTPELAIAAQLLHGPCFALLWTAGVLEARALAPRGLETTAQSLFGTAVFGIGGAIMSTAGGLLYRDFGYASVFYAGAATALLGAIGIMIGLRGAAQPAEPASAQ